jgi:two-component sensor histidine kinase
MSHGAQAAARSTERESPERPIPLELAIDLEAENARLRAALARSEGAGVRRDLITRELTHRIGNLLAVVQAVARQTFANADALSLEDFSARLLALGAAQKLLIESETRAATIADVVATALAPHCIDGERATFSGPALALDGRRAHGLTLALHELATNAAKYGALSVESGWIEVVWTAHDGNLDFLWSEHNGPPTSPPTRRGFGSRLITRNLGIAFGGSVDLSFKLSGVECRLIAPLRSSVTDASGQAAPASAASLSASIPS